MGTAIGLDIGTTGIRAVEATTGARTTTVRKAYSLPLPQTVFYGGKLAEPVALTDHLKRLWRKAKFSKKDVHLVIGSHPAVLVRAAITPYAAKTSDMAAIVGAEADRVLPGDKGYHLGHHVVAVEEEVTDDGTVQHAHLSIAAADADYLDAILDAITGADLTPRSVDVTSFALSRLVATAASPPGRLDILVHLGASTASVIALHEGQFTYQRIINDFAGATLTDELAGALGVSLEEAEHIKTSPPASGQVSTTVASAAPMIAQWSTALVAEIADAINQASMNTAKPVGRVWLTGGSARLPDLAARLDVTLPAGAQAALLDPAAWVRGADKLIEGAGKKSQDMAVALAASVQRGA